MARLNTSAPAPARPSVDTLLSDFQRTLSLSLRATWLSDTLTKLQESAHPPAGPALQLSLKGRVLGSDITASLNAHANLCFPPNVHELNKHVLAGPVAVQVLAVEDLTVSKGEQLDRMEMVERGEVRRGRQVIRVVPDEDGQGGPGAQRQSAKTGMCKLLLEDAARRRVWAIELKSVDGIKGGMNIGTKMVLKGVEVARGVVLLAPGNVAVLGGKIDTLHQAWIAGRKDALKAEIEAMKNGQRGV